MDGEDMLYNEKKDEEDREKIIEQERKGMKKLNKRKDVVIQAADKGGAIAVMEKVWYGEKMKEQILEGYKVVGENNRETKEEIINKIIRNSEGKY